MSKNTFPKGFNEASALPHPESEEGRRRLAELGLEGSGDKPSPENEVVHVENDEAEDSWLANAEVAPAGADADDDDSVIEGFGDLSFTPPTFSEDDADALSAELNAPDTIQPIHAGPDRMLVPDDGRLTVVASPYGGDIEKNTAYARACLSDCLDQGEAPFASHLLYTQPGVLDDADPVDRGRGIIAGLAWMRYADRLAVYTDLGVSSGMGIEIAHALAEGVVVEYRSLGSDFMDDFSQTYGV